MFAFNKVVSHSAVVTSNRITLKVKNVAFLCVFATERCGNSISCTQIVGASSREDVSIQVPQQYYHFWPQPIWKNNIYAPDTSTRRLFI